SIILRCFFRLGCNADYKLSSRVIYAILPNNDLLSSEDSQKKAKKLIYFFDKDQDKRILKL
ncbi:hypothetical protein, partial [Legionella jamestowniensis]|uniref:hypothetical protein n=1 Tax=Legionella jamestowniensis TaxID=455 RepID=UPI001C3FFE38